MVFLGILGRLLGVSYFRDKCAGFTIKISCETLGFPGNLVPWFPGIIPPWLELGLAIREYFETHQMTELLVSCK